MSQFVADFLEFARLEAKEYKPLLAPCDIQAEIRKSIEAVALEARKKRITIAIEPQETMLPAVKMQMVLR